MLSEVVVDVYKLNFDAEGVTRPGHYGSIDAGLGEKMYVVWFSGPSTLQKILVPSQKSFMEIDEFRYGVFFRFLGAEEL